VSAWGRRSRRQALAAQALRKRAERDRRLAAWPDDWDRVLAEIPGAAAIADLSATELVAKLQSGDLKAVDVMRVFCARARSLGPRYCLLAEEAFEEAMAAARKADADREAGRPLRPLHGLPFSVKDCVDMAGYDSTCGLAVRTFAPAPADAVLVALLKEQGAIPFVRTNVPQLLMLPESDNLVWGCALNPFDITRTPGGSSGGEAGLIAARGSPCGIGTDIGGSIRIPAHMCGICGFLPTVGRLSGQGCRIPRPGDRSGQMAIRASGGPMARCVADLHLLLKTWCQVRMSELDTNIPPIPWREEIYQSERPLKIGYYTTDKYFTPAPACVRAVEEAVAALKARGHEVVPFEVDFYRVAINYLSILGSDGGLRNILGGLEGEELIPMYQFLKTMASMPNVLRPPIAAVLRLAGLRRMADLTLHVGGKDAYQHWETVADRNEWRRELLVRWQAAGLDAVLCPGLALPAFPHGTSNRLNQGCSYTFVWNSFGFPAGALPAATVRPAEEPYGPCPFGDALAKDAALACEGSAGLPVGIQVVALPFHDELCLRAMREAEAALAFPGPMPPVDLSRPAPAPAAAVPKDKAL